MADKYYWTLLILGLLFLSYSAYAIRNEKKHYYQSAKDISFKGLQLKIPSWWQESWESDSSLNFKRADTYYDWSAQFKFCPFDSSKFNDVNEILNLELKSRKIEIDQDTQIKNELNLIFAKEISYARIEGTGTLDHEERVYLDLLILKKEMKTWIISSQSSVLNGCVEGPYFDEVLKNISFE